MPTLCIWSTQFSVCLPLAPGLPFHPQPVSVSALICLEHIKMFTVTSPIPVLLAPQGIQHAQRQTNTCADHIYVICGMPDKPWIYLISHFQGLFQLADDESIHFHFHETACHTHLWKVFTCGKFLELHAVFRCSKKEACRVKFLLSPGIC